MSVHKLYYTGVLTRIIAHVDTASDNPLTSDEEFIVAMAEERDRLQAIVNGVASTFEPEMDPQLAIDEQMAVRGCREAAKGDGHE